MGHKKAGIRNKFGHLLEAFKYGVPPHGGIAPGLDRFLAILQNEPNIREVIAFSKTGDSRDLMMDSPSEVSPDQLKELKIKLDKKKK
jgi:aspartyl-tRNA synthetase